MCVPRYVGDVRRRGSGAGPRHGRSEIVEQVFSRGETEDEESTEIREGAREGREAHRVFLALGAIPWRRCRAGYGGGRVAGASELCGSGGVYRGAGMRDTVIVTV